MEIIEIGGYLDGGTIKIITNNEIYCIDSRIGTKSRGNIFLGYPKDDNSNMISNQVDINMKIRNAIERYRGLDFGNFDWKPGVYELLNSL